MKKKHKKRDPNNTKLILLKEATRVFSKYGFKGGPISDIFKAANVNKRMIYHYFGNKEGLYKAVLTFQWETLKDWIFQGLESKTNKKSLDDREMLFILLDLFFDFLSRNENFVRLLMWDGLEGGSISTSIWDEVRAPFFKKIEDLIFSTQKKGLLNPNLLPSHFIISFLGSTTFYFAYASSMSKMLQLSDPFQADALLKRKEQLFLQLKLMLKES